MKTFRILLCLPLLCLAACNTTAPGILNDLLIVYTGNGAEIQNTAIKVVPGQEAVTATGVGWDLKLKTAYVTYADGHTSRLKITGAGFGGGKAVILLEGGARITVDVHTGAVTTS